MFSPVNFLGKRIATARARQLGSCLAMTHNNSRGWVSPPVFEKHVLREMAAGAFCKHLQKIERVSILTAAASHRPTTVL